jgi:serine/threonine protein kinase
MLTGAGSSLWVWLKNYFTTKGQQLKSPQVLELLAQVGDAAPADVAKLVDNFAKQVHLSDAQRQELRELLIRMVHGAKKLNSEGTPRSSYLRCEKLLEQLLDGLRTKRTAGEPIGKGQNWILERFLGMGAFGEVWLARNNKAKLKPRAYKFFTREGTGVWLQKEADNLSALMSRLDKEPGIVPLVDVGISDQECPFLGFEYVGGGSLEDWVLEDPDARTPLPVADIIAGIARSMAAAHHQGIFHRDLKPGNILLTENAPVYPRITDFGLALAQGPSEATGASLGLAQVGTPMYWPPDAHRLDHVRCPAQDDVFAIGVIWYQMLVGKLVRPPYDYEAELRGFGQDSYTIRLLSRCLAHPLRRFADAGHLADALDVVLPEWNPVPEGLYDVQYLMREYVAATKL